MVVGMSDDTSSPAMYPGVCLVIGMTVGIATAADKPRLENSGVYCKGRLRALLNLSSQSCVVLAVYTAKVVR